MQWNDTRNSLLSPPASLFCWADTSCFLNNQLARVSLYQVSLKKIFPYISISVLKFTQIIVKSWLVLTQTCARHFSLHSAQEYPICVHKACSPSSTGPEELLSKGFEAQTMPNTEKYALFQSMGAWLSSDR